MDWLDTAISHAATTWSQTFLRTYLPKLRNQTFSPHDFATAFDQVLQARRLNTLAHNGQETHG